MMMNIGLYASFAGLLVTLTFAFLWQLEKTKTAELQGKLDVYEQQVDILKNEIEHQRNTLTESLKLVDENAQLLTRHDQAVSLERLKVEELKSEINDLRAKELEDAMQDPFNRGNRATDRWNNVMQLISGKQSGQVKDYNDPDVAQSGYTGTADSAVN